MEGALKMIISWMILGFLLCPQASASLGPSEDYFGSVSLVQDDIYHLYWRTDDTSIVFEVHAKVKGWVGFGLSPNGGMAKSDIVIGGVKDGVPYFSDRYAPSHGVMPTIDASQDWTLIAAEETATHTMLKFKRPLYSCDPEDRQITEDTLRVIFAYSDTDPSSEDAVMYHEGNRGSKSLLLIARHEKPPPMPADAFYKDFLSNSVTVPGDSHTTYWCQGYNAPPMNGKHHLIKIDPIIQPGNEVFVHHMVLYGCYHKPQGVELFDESQGNICYGTHNMPWKECVQVVAAWGVGGTPFNFPDHVGLPFGDAGGILFLRLAIHYDNPQLTKGVVDSSGLRLWFTKSLRQYDAAMFGTGVRVNPVGHILPAGYPDLKSYGYCTKDCLAKAMGTESEIYVFSAFLHTHLLAVGIKVHHYRDGVEKSYLISDLAYDFNYQQTRAIVPEITIKAGDNLAVECTYDTEDKKKASYGGLGTSEEMCLAMLYYYPAINLIYCTSMPTQANMAKHLSLRYEGGQGYTRAMINDGPYSGKTLNQFFEAIGKLPDQATMEKYQEGVRSGDIMQNCQHRHNNTQTATQVPAVLSVYQEKARQCSAVCPTQPPSATVVTMLCSCGLLMMMLLAGLTTN